MVRVKNTSPQKDRNKPSIQFIQVGSKQFAVKDKLLKQIKKLQNRTDNCIPKKCFSVLIREIIQEQYLQRNDLRIQAVSLKALQEAAEMYLVQLFEDSNLCAAHANRITVRSNDMRLALTLRGSADVFNH